MTSAAVEPASSTSAGVPTVSSSTLKIVMALTGIVLIGFVFVHMVGNLKAFLGPEHLDDYARYLRYLGVPIAPHESILWALRVALLLSVIAHIAAAAALTARSRRHGAKRAARRTRVGRWRSFTSRTMPVSGIVIGAFVVFHILDLTLGTAGGAGFRHPETIGGDERYYAYDNLVASLERPVVAAFYILSMLVLGAHLLHGSWSAIHDLGVTGRRWRRALLAVATVIVAAVMVGNISIPVAVQLGVVS